MEKSPDLIKIYRNKLDLLPSLFSGTKQASVCNPNFPTKMFAYL